MIRVDPFLGAPPARASGCKAIGPAEVRDAYDRIHSDYDASWLVHGGRPIRELVDRLPWSGRERTFEAGCGTGYATTLLATRCARVLAVDLSTAMLEDAQRRLDRAGQRNVTLAAADALARLTEDGPFDRIFTSWALGYIPLAPFFAAANRALNPGGRVAFVVHQGNSPREPVEIFNAIIIEEPAALLKIAAFDFPRDVEHVRTLVHDTGLEIEFLETGQLVFTCDSAERVLEHLLNSGAATAFAEAVDPARRRKLTRRFLDRLRKRHPGAMTFSVPHDYIVGIAHQA